MLKFINLVLFAIAIVVGITFLTVDKPPLPSKVEQNKKPMKLSLSYFPKKVEVIGMEKLVETEEIFKKGSKTLLVVGNHDSIAVIRDLEKYFNINIPYVMVANMGHAPWFIKKWAIPTKLQELTRDLKSPMIFDDEGFIARALALNNTEVTKYFVYLINENGSINKVYTGNVKEGAMEYGYTSEEAKEALEPILKFLK